MAQKPIEQKIATMEELLYGEIPNTAIYSDPDEFEEAKETFKVAQIGKEFSGTFYWKEWMKPQVEAQAKQAAREERSYNGFDKERQEKLRQNRICADFVLNYLNVAYLN